jgi:hypothetical protein
MKRVLVCGGRDFEDRVLFDRIMGGMARPGEKLFIIAGGARGADYMAESWAKAKGHEFQEYRADWPQHGKAAGPIRNQQMLDEGRPDLVVAFPGGAGTADMVARAKNDGVQVIRITYEN